MGRRFLLAWAALAAFFNVPEAVAQVEDSLTNVYQLGPVVIHGRAPGLDLEGFMRQVMEDTTFLHAFLNLRYYPHVVASGFTVRGKGEKEQAAIDREARLLREGPFARMPITTERETGKLRDRKGNMRYLTAELYDDLFFPKGQWRADNTIASYERGSRGSGRIGRYKAELKKFMFNPGHEIAGLPLIGGKLAIFDPAMAPLYDFGIGQSFRNGRPCWEFTAVSKDTLGAKAARGATVIKSMRTWFDQQGMQVLAREYRIAHASLIMDFDINVQVENTLVGGVLVPSSIRYEGDWDIPLRKREWVKFWLRLDDWTVEQMQ